MKLRRELAKMARWMMKRLTTMNFLFLGSYLGLKCMSLSRGG